MLSVCQYHNFSFCCTDLCFYLLACSRILQLNRATLFTTKITPLPCETSSASWPWFYALTHRIRNRISEKETHLSEFAKLLPMATWNFFHIPGKATYCLIPGTLQKSQLVPTRPYFFSENSMRLLNWFWFRIGSDFGLRIGFGLTQEVNEADKSQFIYSLKIPHLTVRCLQPEVNIIVPIN